MNYLKSFFLIFLFTLSFNSYSQNKETKFSDLPLKERIFLGGNLGLQFGNTTTYVEVSPLIGLWLSPSIVVGTGPVYRYYRFKFNNFTFEDNQYGGRVFGRYYFLTNFFAHAEYELLNLSDTRDTKDFPDYPRTNLSSVLLGGGFVQPIGDGRSAFFITVLINLNETELTPYPNPVIRAGFNIGL